jgi:tRNA(Ile)-lysidine synthase
MSRLTGDEIDGLFESFVRCDKIGLAVSGGPDSLALMLLAAQWARGQDSAPQVFVYTVDHGLRPEAAAEARMVVREAQALGFTARPLRWEGDKPSTGIQAAARTARYRLMADAMQRDGVELLATAHHLADQAETVLMRLAHGSGIDGLRGMDRLSWVEGCEVVRPLLGVRPELLREVVSDAGLAPANDPSNGDENYERVRWRLMQPALEALGLTIERLGTFARRMDEASSLIHAQVEEIYPRIVTPLSGTRMELDGIRFAHQNPAVATQLLGHVLGLVAGDRRSPPLGPLELIARRLQQPEPLKGITLHGCLVSSDGEAIWVKKEGPRRSLSKRNSADTSN